MANLVSSVCVLVIYLIKNSYSASTTRYVSYNSSDLSYLSNGIQIPLPSLEDQEPINQESMDDNLSELEWLSHLYSHHAWEKRLDMIENNECQNNLLVYFKNLKNGTSWAVKMNDASGRYSSQFFFGNDYWLGSSSLCKELEIPEVNFMVPPFPLSFYVAKIRININEELTPVTRQLNLGQCLPRSCSVADVRRLLVQERFQGTSLSVVGVRTVPGEYSMLLDYKFHLLSGVAIAAVLLVISGTLLEFRLKGCNNQPESDIRHNGSNSITGRGNEKPKVLANDKDHHRSKLKTIIEFCTRMLLCFSALQNAKKILNVDKLPKDSITCLHGLRFLSIAWIILVHTYLEVFAVADNKSLRIVTERTFIYQTISNATFSVDTFFFISGLLVTIGYLRREFKKSAEATNQEVNTGLKSEASKYLIIVFYRYIRLTPAYLFVLGMNEVVIRYFHNNSVYSPAMIDHVTCPVYWWRNALYINNFFSRNEFCMLWSWYMANDTQFFAIAVILLAIAIRNEKCFKCIVAAVIVFMMSSWVTTFIIAIKYKYVARIEEPFALFDELYDKPWMRVGPYLIGMATGYILLKLDGKLVLPKFVALLFWALSISCLLSLVYGIGKEGLVIPVSAFYASLGHTAWGLSIAWITIACCHGYGEPMNSVLSFRGILPLSRLTYCAYLVHPMIMCITSFQLDGPIHLHQGIIVIIFFGNMVASFLMAFAISLCFETPFVHLLKVISNKQK